MCRDADGGCRLPVISTTLAGRAASSTHGPSWPSARLSAHAQVLEATARALAGGQPGRGRGRAKFRWVTYDDHARAVTIGEMASPTCPCAKRICPTPGGPILTTSGSVAQQKSLAKGSANPKRHFTVYSVNTAAAPRFEFHRLPDSTAALIPSQPRSPPSARHLNRDMERRLRRIIGRERRIEDLPLHVPEALRLPLTKVNNGFQLGLLVTGIDVEPVAARPPDQEPPQWATVPIATRSVRTVQH